MIKSILLIGDTQSGKSTFGNYLISKNIFESGTSLFSCTDHVQNYILDYYLNLGKEDFEIHRNKSSFDKDYKINIIDTPGINHTNQLTEDLIMLNFYTYLYNNVDKLRINNIFLIVKYRSTIGQTFIDTLKFYKTLFGNLFDNVLTIIFTNYKQSDEWQMEQKYETKKSPRKLIDETLIEIKKILGNRTIPSFFVNSLPLNRQDTEYMINIRKVILDGVCLSEGSLLNNIKFPKMKSHKLKDEEEVNILKGQIIGINETIRNYQGQIKYINNNIIQNVKKMDENQLEIKKMISKLTDINTIEQKLLLTQEFCDNWHIFKWWGNQQIDMTFDYNVTKIDAFYGNKDQLEIHNNRVIGILYGYIFKNMSCYLNFYTSYQIYYKKEIFELEIKIESKKIEQNVLSKQYEDLTSDDNDANKIISDYKNKIDKLSEKIGDLTKDIIELKYMVNFIH